MHCRSAITNKSGFPEEMDGCSRMLRSPPFPRPPEPAQEQVRAISKLWEIPLAAEQAQPDERCLGPRAIQVTDELSGQQDQDEQAPHPFQGSHAQIFDVQTLLLIEAIAMLDQ